MLKVDLRKKEDDRPFNFNSRGFKCVFWFFISSYGSHELSGWYWFLALLFMVCHCFDRLH